MKYSKNYKDFPTDFPEESPNRKSTPWRITAAPKDMWILLESTVLRAVSLFKAKKMYWDAMYGDKI